MFFQVLKHFARVQVSSAIKKNALRIASIALGPFWVAKIDMQYVSEESRTMVGDQAFCNVTNILRRLEEGLTNCIYRFGDLFG